MHFDSLLIVVRCIKEATQNALEREEGWSSKGEDSDGGAPVAPEKKKPTHLALKKRSPHRKGPWRPAAVSGDHSAPSKDSWEQVEQKPSAHGSTFPSSTSTSAQPKEPTNEVKLDAQGPMQTA